MQIDRLAGQMALGSRLRRLGDTFLQQAEQLYERYGVDIDARWFPVFYLLTTCESMAITELAKGVGQTHPAVSQVVRGMLKRGLVSSRKNDDDARVNQVALTDYGRQVAAKLEPQCLDIDAAINKLLTQLGSHLWDDLSALEKELENISLVERAQKERRIREQQHVRLLSYEDKFQTAFHELNRTWIEEHFELERSDREALDNPQGAILNSGGYIAIALYREKPVGTCALIKHSDSEFELAKMTVSSELRGLGIGAILGKHVLAKAKQMGAKRVYLESNTKLQPAINLYRQLGFKRVTGVDSPYQRCNIHMEILL